MSALSSLWRTPERRIALLLVIFLCALYIPFAGNYGLWDPWETHYSEVARQMLMRHDYVSLWWPGSPLDRNEFWSKPVLTFWLMAMGMAVSGLERASHLFDGEMAVGWTAEWSVRIPFILCGIACVWSVWELVRRLAGRRAGLWAALVLATSTQFFFVTRQAMTDMAFVAPIAVALCFAGLAVMLPEAEVGAELPRRSRKLGRFTLSWPHAKIFYVTVGMALVVVVPQLLIISLEVVLSLPIGRHVVKMSGVVPMLPWIAATVGYVVGACFMKNRRQLYFHIAFIMGGVSTLAKGPAGIALPVIVLVMYIVATREWRWAFPKGEEFPAWLMVLILVLVPLPLLIIVGFVIDVAVKPQRNPMWAALRYLWRHPLQPLLGTVVFLAVAAPWYHAMIIRHGMGFWNEFIGDNYVHRAAGRHGDRGTFEYYILQIGHGMFPWIGVVAAAMLASLRKVVGSDARSRLRLFALVWFLVMFGTMSLVNTKFHHYILPGLPALAILGGLYLDDLLSSPTVGEAWMLLVAGLPILGLAARDLAMFPARLTWLFDYDYVNAPNGGRPWPTTPEYDYSMRIAAFGIVVGLATLAVGVTALLRAYAARRQAEPLPEAAPATENASATAPAGGEETTGVAGWMIAAGLGVAVAVVVAAELWQPTFTDGPHPLANGWILVGAAAAVVMALLLASGLRTERTRAQLLALVGMGVVACMWTGWALDRHLTDLSPHWSQKHVIASYYLLRHQNPDAPPGSPPDEPLIAWQMYWRGETFYTKNAIYDHRFKQEDKTVFLQDKATEKLQTFLKTHTGRRVFFIVERSRFESLRALLPEASRPTLHAVDETNNKIYLAVANI